MAGDLLDRFGRFVMKTSKNAPPCPRCEGPGEETGGTVTCRDCGFVGALMEWLQATSGAPSGQVGSPPRNSRIKQHEPSPGAVAFDVPATGKSGGLLFFALLWIGATAVGSVGLLFAIRTQGIDWSDSDLPIEFVPLILIVFWAVGLGLLSAGLRAKFSKHLLVLHDKTLICVSEFFGKKKTSSFPFSGITSIAVIEFYRSNYEPVYGVEIRSASKKFRFGTSLDDDEKGWLVAELKALVFPEKSVPTTMTAGIPTKRDRFELVIPAAPLNASYWSSILIALIIVGSFLALGLSPLMKDAGAFRPFWTGLNLLFLAVVISIFIWTLIQSRIESKVIYDGKRVAVLRLRNTRTISEEAIDAEEVRRVALYAINNANRKHCYSVALIAEERVLLVFRWRPIEIARPFAEDLRKRLDLPE